MQRFKINPQEDGKAFEFDYDGGDAEENSDVTDAIFLLFGGGAGKVGKEVIVSADKFILGGD